ncbi:monothiol glutaredoxin-S2-like [Dioscorea cayenensis subsp. rotundata]|uniref:Monothiol glutaredoxin-S2-like n=1 Tax=Dioscorea cayennensis subsp. rotundata TaxID=55577 RepID=A0AB40BKA9_DIOCR|nr:monothiol glutaredoxin-S2-like [Dioscorea cayenensis subsp. rotundata]
MEIVKKLAYVRPVVIFSKSSCCMCAAVKKLFSEIGANKPFFDVRVNLIVYELDEFEEGREMENVLANFGNEIPTIFLTGKINPFSANQVMTLSAQGILEPMVINASAQWVRDQKKCRSALYMYEMQT